MTGPEGVATSVAAPGTAVEVGTWRPVDTAEVDGWLLGFSGGFTRRANSVVPWRAPGDTVAAVEAVEDAYGSHGLPSVFRVDAAAQPAHLDALLAERGYAAVARTRVMARDLDGGVPVGPGPAEVGIDLADHPDEPWLAGWLDVKAAGRAVDTDLARAVVTGSPALYLTARDDDGVTGVVRAATAGEWVGLSCLMVAERARRRGLAGQLSARALAEAGARGARRAFLQVETSNTPAAALYAALGFAVVDEYHYRELRAG